MYDRFRAPTNHRPYSIFMMTTLVLIIMSIFMYILFTGKYSEKILVSGVINLGENIRITPEVRGYVANILVKEGEQVSKGDSLIEVIRTPTNTIIPQEGDSAINLSRKYLKENLARTEELVTKLLEQKKRIKKNHQYELRLLSSQQKLVNKQEKIIKDKTYLLSKQLSDLSKLLQSGDISEKEYSEVKQALLSSKRSGLDIKSSKNKVLNDKATLEKQLISNLSNIDNKLHQLYSNIEQLKADQLDLKKNETNTIFSPVDGKVLFIPVSVGSQYSGRHPIIILQENKDSNDFNENLKITLYVPSDKFMWFDKDQEVIVRVSSLPYESYGVLTAKIHSISNTSINTQMSAGKEDQIFYEVTLKIDDSHSQRKTVPTSMLADNMAVSAYLKQPNLTLLEWLFLPVKKSFIRNPYFYE